MLFRLTGSVNFFLCSVSLSWTNAWYCSNPIPCSFFSDSCTAGSTMSLLCKVTKSELLSKKGFPVSWITSASFDTSPLKFSWKPLLCSWWRSFDNLSSLMPSSDVSNSWMMRETSGPLTIHRLSAEGLSVSPTAPPSPLIIALFCSWAWSRAIFENERPDFCRTKWPFLNSSWVVVWTACVSFMSLMWTVNHLA